MKKFAKHLLALLLMVLSHLAFAQNVEMADGLRSEGKIYVVVIIILIVLAGLITYLFLLDRKVARMEKLINERLKPK